MVLSREIPHKQVSKEKLAINQLIMGL
uniref:Uncharacterized protein n=1 Tax=Rhizophora mucronata TaxID=61149 RepID=A0A2P2NS38_RHIMU